MSEQPPQKFKQANPFQRFTIRLIDGKFVRVPKADLPSMEAAKHGTANNLTEIRDLFRLVNGRFTRLLNLDADMGMRVGQLLADLPKDDTAPADPPVAKKKG